MKLRNLFSNNVKQKVERRWFGSRPDARLELKLNAILPETTDENAEFILLNYDLLKKLIDADAVPRSYSIRGDQIFKNDPDGAGQQHVNCIDQNDLLLIDQTLKYRKLNEVLQISILTESKEFYRSDILAGEEKFVGNISSIQEWIDEHTFYLRRLGHSITHIFIDHVHPSLEVVAVTDAKFTSITNGLSRTDVKIAEKISEHLMYPLTISAILPSGLKYSRTFSP